jgi:hypothetical protein
MMVKGRVVASYTGAEALDDIDRLSQKYLGHAFPSRHPRISFLIVPTFTSHMQTSREQLISRSTSARG